MKVLLICIGIAMFLSGCKQSDSPYPGDAGLRYPGDASLSVQRIPSPPSLIPTPHPTKGTITGRLYNAATGKPISGMSLYFASILPLTPAPGFFITLDPVNSPNVPISADGSFIMANITPGKYALVLWTPQRATYVSEPNEHEKVLIVDVTAGQIIDLGELTTAVP